MDIGRRHFLSAACLTSATAALGVASSALGQTVPRRPREAPDKLDLPYDFGKTLYENPMATEKDVAGFKLEGQAKITFETGRARIENTLPPEMKQKANIVWWCPEAFPDNVSISWEFSPLREPGLAIAFFSALGKNGEDIFDSKLSARTGEYPQYHHGDINALHVSYFRRNAPKTDMQLYLSNLRKSYGFHLVAQGADPIPPVAQASPPYTIQVVKIGPRVIFSIESIQLFDWTDDGKTYGSHIPGGGRFGLRQMSPLIAEYANLKVQEVTLRKSGAR
jgi:hypothetical protein